jgi:ubiquinone/menaquinone biosynthesis C-methylase UbiE
MSNAFAGSVPDNYDKYLRPLLFEPYADDLVRRLQLKPAMRVLEVACGTGIVTRKLLGRIPGDATLVATDLSEQMIAIAEQRVSPDPRLAWQPADALSLPFDAASFDAVVCQFGVMFFPDKAKGLTEMRRVLKPGGQLLLNAWDSLLANPVVDTVHQALAQAFPSNPPRFLTVPYGFDDRNTILQLVSDAGFRDVHLRDVALDGHSASARDVAAGFVMGTPLVPEMKEKGLSSDVALPAVERAVAAAFGAGPIVGPMSAIVVDARTPAAATP